MNALDRIPPSFPPDRRPPTQAAEGLPRWRWTTAELLAAVRAGIIHEDERLELIGGEMVPMSPKGNRHEILRIRLTLRLSRMAPDDPMVAGEPQLNLTDDSYTNPDILVHPLDIDTPFVRGGTALLLIEVADSSLEYDLTAKAPLYAAHGVREYWVINANTLQTKVHLDPEGSAYRSIVPFARRRRLVPSLVPALANSVVYDGLTTLLAGVLKQQGYRTAAIGKWHLGWDWSIIGREFGPEVLGQVAWPDKLMYIGLSMVATGLVGALAWHRVLIDRRDALILGALPVRPAAVARRVCAGWAVASRNC